MNFCKSEIKHLYHAASCFDHFLSKYFHHKKFPAEWNILGNFLLAFKCYNDFLSWNSLMFLGTPTSYSALLVCTYLFEGYCLVISLFLSLKGKQKKISFKATHLYGKIRTNCLISYKSWKVRSGLRTICFSCKRNS